MDYASGGRWEAQKKDSSGETEESGRIGRTRGGGIDYKSNVVLKMNTRGSMMRNVWG